MKIGIISNNLYCTHLLRSLQQSGAVTSVWADGREAANLMDWCRHQRIAAASESGTTDLYLWMNAQDLVFVIGYNRRIRSLPSAPAYNVHFGPLPQYRGPSPVFWQLKEGRKELGLSIHELSPRMDAGPVVWEKAVANEAHFTYSYVHILFSELLVEGVYSVINGQGKLKARTQDESKAVTQPRPKLQDVMIDWQRMDAEEICRLIKACNAWNTGALTSFYGNELTLIDAVAAKKEEGVRGTIAGTENGLTIHCHGGGVLDVRYLRLNQLPFPGRWAGKLGMMKGQSLGT